jgi:hypothetical protein
MICPHCGKDTRIKPPIDDSFEIMRQIRQFVYHYSGRHMTGCPPEIIEHYLRHVPRAGTEPKLISLQALIDGEMLYKDRHGNYRAKSGVFGY